MCSGCASTATANTTAEVRADNFGASTPVSRTFYLFGPIISSVSTVGPNASQGRNPLQLHPDIPEQGPKIGTPAERDAAGFFIGGPMPARPTGILKLMELADVEAEQNAEILTALAEDSAMVAKDERRARRATLKAKRKAELVALCAELRARRAA
jgi:hypothetical protein